MFNALSKLDTDGDGAFKMEDLLRVMEDQQQMSQTVRLQRLFRSMLCAGKTVSKPVYTGSSRMERAWIQQRHELPNEKLHKKIFR